MTLPQIEDVPDALDQDFGPDENDETATEKQARLDTEVVLDDVSRAAVDKIIEKMLIVVDEMSGHPLRPYQTPFAHRLIESLIIGDGATITALWARQSGKALSLDTPIPTPSGWTTQGALKIGDEVFNPNKQPIKVLAVQPVLLERPVYRVTFNDGTYIDADERHEWVLADGRVVETLDLRRKMCQLCDSQDGFGQHWVVMVEPIASVPVRCITVEGSIYLAGKGEIPTHNSETIANTVAACMVMLPKLAVIFPTLLGKFSEGLWVGAFAPVEEQADTLFGRIVMRLTSERAMEVMADPEIDDSIQGGARQIRLRKNGSLCRKQTAHPRATIEGRTYHLILLDEAQGSNVVVVNKSIGPMGAATNATMVFTGTPTYEKGVFYQTIQFNKRQDVNHRSKQNHFEADWKEVSRWNANYKKFVSKEMLRIGEESDEFKLAYRLMWLLDRGMFITSERLTELGDISMQVVHSWHKTPVVVGIDPARKVDSTVVTVVWVDWDHPDEFGYYEHRILNWLDLTGMEWEEQYFRIVEFLANYNVYAIGIDAGGLGDVVGSRLKVLMPNTPIEMMGSQRPDQSKRWKHMLEMISRGKIGWPAHAKTRRLKTYRRFIQQMSDLEKKFEGPYVLAEAPNAIGVHDDYCDALCLSLAVAQDSQMPTIEVTNSPWW